MPNSNAPHSCVTIDENGKPTVVFQLGTDPQVNVSVSETPSGTLLFNLQQGSFEGDIADIDGLFFNLTNDGDTAALNFFPDENSLPVTGHSANANSEDSLIDHPGITDQYDGVINFGLIENSNSGQVDTVNFTLWSDDGPLTLQDLDLTDLTLVIDGDDGDPQVLNGGVSLANGEDILVNGDLDANVADGSYNVHAEAEGWTNDNGAVEAWGNGFLGIQTEDGGSFIELDRMAGGQVDNLYQDVATQEGQSYVMSFNAMQRGADHDSIEVYWQGELIDTVIPSSNSEWDTFSYTLEGTSGDDRLEFRELASENDCTGPLMDNISLKEHCPEPTVCEASGEDILVNGDIDANVADGRYNVHAEAEGWTNDNGAIEAWGNGFHGIQTEDGGSFIELDRMAGGQVDNLYQDVATQEGQTYNMSFNAMQRGADQDSIEVYWQGELIDTVTPGSNSEWETFTYEVEGSGGDDRLEFRELASENDCTGPLMDNISLTEVCPGEEECDASGEDILVNGGIDANVEDSRFNVNAEAEGWTNDNGAIEAWGNHFHGIETEDGGSFIELDRMADDQVDNLYQDVATDEGQTYHMSFNAMQRGADQDSIEVYWQGELIDTVRPSSNSEWQTFSYDLEGSGGEDRLEFRELASENDCTGPLMDNISLVEVCDDHEHEEPTVDDITSLFQPASEDLLQQVLDGLGLDEDDANVEVYTFGI